jgi:hypothetical protein
MPKLMLIPRVRNRITVPKIVLIGTVEVYHLPRGPLVTFPTIINRGSSPLDRPREFWRVSLTSDFGHV